MVLEKYIISYEKLISDLDNLCIKYSNIITKEKEIAITTFGFPINYYKIGSGKIDAVLISATHGLELVTVSFIYNFINNIVKPNGDYLEYLEKYTFHIIPVLNPEGYIISSSNVLYNIKDMDIKIFENFCLKYHQMYEKDDENADKGILKEKLYKTLMHASLDLIKNINLRNNVEKIIKDCNLDTRILPVWQTNGMGIDINANSIHEFDNIKKLKNKQKFASLRYNDIPMDRPSPNGFPGDYVFDKNCPENLALFNFINSLYSKGNLKLFISYHSTGREIYGYPNPEFATNNQYKLILNGINLYSKHTGYIPINEKVKYGVMDYYRLFLENTMVLTVELSKLNGNPIGPFSDTNALEEEFKNNIKSIFHTLESSNK